MTPIPRWILRYAAPRFVNLAAASPLCAWTFLSLGLLSIAICVWQSMRGYQLAQADAKPQMATGARAISGLAWLVAIALSTWAMGLEGPIPLAGDAFFIAFAGLVCLEWYVWWNLPAWIGRLTELAVMAVIWWLAWRIAAGVPAKASWYVFVLTSTPSIVLLANEKLHGHVRRIFLRNVLPSFVLTGLMIPSLAPLNQVPPVPLWLLWGSISCLLAWLGVVLGAFWMRLPESFTNLVAPFWIVLCSVLAKLGVPFFSA